MLILVRKYFLGVRFFAPKAYLRLPHLCHLYIAVIKISLINRNRLMIIKYFSTLKYSYLCTAARERFSAECRIIALRSRSTNKSSLPRLNLKSPIDHTLLAHRARELRTILDIPNFRQSYLPYVSLSFMCIQIRT